MHVMHRALACATVIAIATMALAVQPAEAGEILEGQVYGVFAEGGDFGGGYNAGQSYTVVRFLDFAGGNYPDAIEPVGWPSTGFDPVASGIAPGSDFFLIGSITGVPEQEIDHLLLSVSEADRGLPEFLFKDIDEPLHQDLIVGTQNLRNIAPGPVEAITADVFWGNFGGEQIANDFFALDLLHSGGEQSPIVSLSEGSFAFEGGSEDLFGYNPFKDRDGSCFCGAYAWLADLAPEFLARKYESSPFWRKLLDRADAFCNPDGNERYTGALVTGLPGDGTIGRIEQFGTPGGGTFQNPVPEPGTLALLGSSLLVGFGVQRRRRRNAA